MTVQGGRDSVGSCHIATRFPYTIILRILGYHYRGIDRRGRGGTERQNLLLNQW